MLSIEIRANNKLLGRYKVKNFSELYGIPYGKGKQIYHTEYNDKIIHKFEDGFLVLAIKTLKKYKKKIKDI